MKMTLEEMLEMEAKCYVAMAEIDYDLRKWHARHYSPSLSMQRAFLYGSWNIRRALEKGVADAQAAIASFGRALPPGRHRGTSPAVQ